MSPLLAAAVAFLAGLAVMMLELCAVRLLAPHFGDSAYVWTNVIGVILAALAAGALIGGRLADARSGPRGLAGTLLAAAALTVAVPFLAGVLGPWLVPQDLPLEAAMPALVRGSLVATLVLFAPPIVLLGAVSPWLVRLCAGAGESVGRAAGSISAAATLGSLGGTFLATHLFVPTFGSRTTVLACAAVLTLAGALCLGGRAKVAACVLPLLATLALPTRIKATSPGEELLAELESCYQFLQVVRYRDGQVPVTALKINEGLDSFHSLARGDGPFTAGAYYDYHVAAPWLARAGTDRTGPVRALSLGSACGTFDRLFAAVHPGCSVDEVEIDPAVTALGDRHFGGKQAAGRRFDLDARVFANRGRGEYDCVLVDAYARQIYVPAHVVSAEFFAGVMRLLGDGGVVTVNLGGTSFADEVVATVGATLAQVFGTAAAFRVPDSRNFLIVARKGRPLERGALADVRTSDSRWQPILAALQQAGAWREYSAGSAAGVVLADGWPWLDALQDAALRQRTQEPTLLAPIRGGISASTAEKAVREALGSGDYERARALLGNVAEFSAYLRFLAGDVRWRLHDPAGAVLEYSDAKRLDSAVVAADQLDSRIAGARALAAPLLRANAIGVRNGWLGAGAALALLLVWLWALRGGVFVVAQKMSSTPAT